MQDTSLYNEIGVLATDKIMPVFYFRSSGSGDESFILTIFESFVPGSQDDSNFEIPSSCLEPNVIDASVKKSLVKSSDENTLKIRSSLFKKVEALMKEK